MESTRTITVICIVLELGPFKHLMEETWFSETPAIKVFKWRGGCGGGGRLQCIHALMEPCTLA